MVSTYVLLNIANYKEMSWHLHYSGKTFIRFVTFDLFVSGLKSSTSGSFSYFTITNDRRQISSEISNSFAAAVVLL